MGWGTTKLGTNSNFKAFCPLDYQQFFYCQGNFKSDRRVPLIPTATSQRPDSGYSQNFWFRVWRI